MAAPAAPPAAAASDVSKDVGRGAVLERDRGNAAVGSSEARI